ncbi:MAG: hypothetical protein ACM3QX_18360 [Syntrophomonadaceae bacterium]
MKPPKELPAKTYSLCEAVADLALNAGEFKLHEMIHDSRQLISDIIQWARDFEEAHKKTNWGIDADYIEEIDKYFAGKAEEVKQWYEHYGENQ